MYNIIFISAITLFFTAVYIAAFRVLPGERWQVFASVPVRKNSSGRWRGVNITWYGILSSTGTTIAFIFFIIMMASAGVSGKEISIISGCMLLLFVPSARVVAYLVEGRKHTLTVGGAIFVMITFAPWLLRAVKTLNMDGMILNEAVFLPSMITAYAFGEGFGRLACISFGCCYGKPVASLPPCARKPFKKMNFVFTGKTKKIAYHDHMDGVETVPVQAITAVLYTASGIAGLYLFMSGKPYASFLLTLVITQAWRVLSEFLGADYRGNGKISMYQMMSLFVIPYYIIYLLAGSNGAPVSPQLTRSFTFLWDPAVILFITALWTGGVLYTGISSVTASEISFYVLEKNIH